MQKIGTADNKFVDGNPVSGTLGTVLPAAWLNSVQDEIANAITGEVGVVLDAGDSSQLAKRLSRLAPLKSPIFTDSPKAPTAPMGNSSALLANTEFVDSTINQKISGLPFSATITVGGDVNTYYPVPFPFAPEHKLNRFIIYRWYDAPHPASLGADHVGGLLLDMTIRGVGWSDFNLTRVNYYNLAYHQTVAAFESALVGRMVWLRGGGMNYSVMADFDMGIGKQYLGTEVGKPIMAANTAIYPLHGASPYAGGGVKVSPKTDADTLWKSGIVIPTNI